MKKLSVVIIVKNEEANIERCLNSVKWADEIVIVDSESTDATVAICQKYGCKIFQIHWLGFGKTKQYAVSQANNDWILSIDADEVVSPSLHEAIINILSSKPEFHGYRIKRKTFYLTKFMNHCGWDRDFPLRLFNRKHGTFNSNLVHESVEVEGNIGRIEEVILHYTYPNLSNHVQKIDRYTTLGAKQDFAKGKRVNIASALFRGFYEFVRKFFFRLGFLDGMDGLILSMFSAYGSMLKYLKIRELGQKENVKSEKNI